MVPSMEKINGKFVPISKLKTFHWLTPTSVSQASYFPPFMFDPSHTCIVTGPQTEWLLPLQGFLLSISMPADLPYLLLTQILSVAYCYLSFFVMWSHPNSHPYTPWSSLHHAWYLFTPGTGQSQVSSLPSPPLILVHFILSIPYVTI